MQPELPLEVDDVRLSDLGPGGWFGLALGGGGLAWGVHLALGGDFVGAALAIGLLGLVGGMFAYEDGTPECDSTCATCGAHVRVHSSRNGVDEYLEAHASGSPRRLSLGPLSVVVGTHELRSVYCSGECAAEDDRVLLDRQGEQIEPVQTSESDHREGVA
ncbi:hypothetical protein [Halosimplex sp. TS25]|uniref:hypothetical protein n=1 Tax=Halosimplex rarum TaxID=3396619 RepID=UPI0039E7803A